MAKLLLHLLIISLTILAVANFVPGISVASLYTAIVVAVLLGLLNLIVKPILLILTLPVNILTFGLFTLVLNGLLFWFLSTVVQGFSVQDFSAAFFGALVVSFVGALTNFLLGRG